LIENCGTIKRSEIDDVHQAFDFYYLYSWNNYTLKLCAI